MSPRSLGPNDVLQDDNYFLWELNARMALARKNLLGHVQVKAKNAMEPRSAEWEASDMKALGILVQLLIPKYQTMVRESRSAREAWEPLPTFFLQKNLHNRVQLRKQLHDFEMAPDENLMDPLMRFEDLFLRLTGVGETVTDDEKLVILLGSLPAEYDGMIKIIEAHRSVTLLDAKALLRREYETLKKREKQEGAFKAVAQAARKDRSRDGLAYRGGARDQGGRGHRGRERGQRRSQQRVHQRNNTFFSGRCFECNKVGHKRVDCPQQRNNFGNDSGEVVFSVNGSKRASSWLLDSGATR